MELVAFILILCMFAWLSARFGVDSRELGAISPEEVLARHGYAWGGKPIRMTRRRNWTHALRHPVAMLLYRLAHWLAPETNRAAAA
jgi:hypothetical protein